LSVVTTQSTFRRLWQPPAKFVDRTVDRRVSFLELFFDLVFVVIVAQLAHSLARDVSWAGVGWFLFLFSAIWSSWGNGTLYYDLHGTNDLSVRVFTFAQMLTVAMMGVFIGDIPGGGDVGFAIAYGVNVALLAAIWFRVGYHDPTHRRASNPYSAAYLLTAILFVASVFVDPSARYWLWAAGLLAEIAGQVIAFIRWSPPESQPGRALIAMTPAMVERLGLFVIIVLGEVIVDAISGVADSVPVHADGIVIGLLGVLVAIGLWWMYFDLISHNAPISSRSQVWFHLHFPVVAAITAGGAGVLNTVAHAADPLPDAVRWLLVGALAAAIVSIGALTFTLEIRGRQPQVYRKSEAAMVISSMLMLGVGLTDWGAKAVLGSLDLLLLAPIAIGLTVWLKHNPPLDAVIYE
jgi:low temperature requirement protein LtrA